MMGKSHAMEIYKDLYWRNNDRNGPETIVLGDAMRHPDKAADLLAWDTVMNDWDVRTMRAISVGCVPLDNQTRK